MGYFFDTFDAVTQGLLSDDSFSIAIQGLLSIDIEEIPIPPTPEEVPEFQPGGVFHDVYTKKKKEEKIYKIKVTVTIDGKKHTEEKIIAKLEKPKVSDIIIQPSTDPSRKINISLIN